MAGEELPPVVATLEGDDASFLAMLERDVEAARVFAADVQAALSEGFGGLTVSGSQISSEGVAAAGEAIGQEMVAGITEGAAGLDLSPEVERSLEGMAEVGLAAGEQVALGIEAGAAAAGEQVVQEVAGPLASGLAEAGASGGEVLGAGLVAGTESVGDIVARQISEQLRLGLDTAAQATMGILGQINASGFGSTLASSAAGAGFLSSLTANLSDAAAEAGGAAGVELARNLSEAAVMALSEADFAAFTDQLIATASAAGGEAGVAAADGLGAGLAAAMPGVDLIAEGLSTVGQAMSVTARAAGQAAAEEMAAVEESTMSGALAFEAELDAVFEAINRQDAGLPAHLAAAMTEAFQGIEADTSAFTATELSLFTEFFQTLEAQGDQAALELASRMNILNTAVPLGTDLMATGTSTIGLPMPNPAEAEAAAAETEKVGAAAKSATSDLGGMAGMLGGPWLWGIMGAASMLPMLSGLFKDTSVSAADFTQAISQDANAVGDNTAATIQNTLAKSNLSALSDKLGLSQAQLIEYAAGEADVQAQVAAAYDAKTAALGKTAGTTEEYGKVAVAVNNASQVEVNQLAASKAALDAVTSSVQQAIEMDREHSDALLAAERSTQIYNAAVGDLVSKMRLQAEQSHMNADATGAYLMGLVPGTEAYTNAVGDQIIALRQSAITAGINATALNDSLPAQEQLSGAALTAAGNYQLASTATGAYTTALNALYGQYGTTSQAQATFTTDLSGLSGQITSGKDAVDLNTAAGAKNFTVFQQAAQAAETYSEKLYQQTGDAGQAQTALQHMASELDTAAGKAHLTTGQIQELNTELFGVPNVKDITIKLDKTPAEQQMAALTSFIGGEINDINNTPITPHVSGRDIAARAAGGPVSAGTPYWVGETGRPEVFVPGSDGYITPMDMLQPVGAGAAAGGGSGGFGGGGSTVVVGDVYLDGQAVGRLVTPRSRSSALQYKTRNSRTGFE